MGGWHAGCLVSAGRWVQQMEGQGMKQRILDIHAASGDADLATTLIRLAKEAAAAHERRAVWAWKPAVGKKNERASGAREHEIAAPDHTDVVGGSCHTEVDG